MSQHYKKRPLHIISSGVSGKAGNNVFDARDPSSRQPFAEIVLLPFHISYHIGKAFVFNKNKNHLDNICYYIILYIYYIYIYILF